MTDEIKPANKEVIPEASVDTVKASVCDHLLIEDAETGEVILNRRG